MRLGLGLGLPNRPSRTASPALALLSGEPSGGMASDFTVPGGSVAVVDPTTPANNIDTDRSWWQTAAGTSPKIVRQADGTLRWSRHNFLQRSQEFNDAVWQKIAFGTGVAPIVTANAGLAPDGTLTADRVELSTGGGNTVSDYSQLAQPIGFVTGLVYTFSIWLKSNTGANQTVRLVIQNSDDGVNRTVTPEWQRFTITLTASVTASSINGFRVRGAQTGLTADVLAWGAQLTWGPSLLDYVPTTSATVFYPAQDYHDTKGWALLVEPSATNIVTNSYVFSDAGWVNGGATKTTGQLAPDGTNTAVLVTANAGGPSTHLITKANFFTTVIAQVYTASIYAKAGTTGWLYWSVGVGGGTAHRVYARFEFATETLTITDSSGSWVKGTTSIVERVGNGWYRLAFSFTDSVAENAGMNFGPASSASLSWTATGTETVYVWAPQIETGAIPTSFIPTGAATVTRAIDRVERASSAVPAGTAYTLFVDADFPAVINTVTSGTLIGVANATSTEVFTLYTNNAATRQHNRTGGVTNADFNLGNAHVANGRAQLVGAFATDDYAGSVNGAAVVTDTAGALAAGTTVIGLGQFGAGSLPVVEPTRIRRVMMVPRRVSNTDLPNWRYAA